MNILWVINIPPPEASKLLGEPTIPFGGWLVNTSMALSEQEDMNLSIAFPRKEGVKDELLKGEKINYYIFKPVKNRILMNHKNSQLEHIVERVNPDIVHIFGTEYTHSLDMINICQGKNIHSIINIQGILSIYSRHYMACIPGRIQRRFTFRDFIKQNNLKQQQKDFINRGKFEVEAICKVKNVIGRTDWDKACTFQINPNVNYYFCNETLRDEFYLHKWDVKNCEKFSIFVSQGNYPIKGLHFMIEAMPLILKRFPKAKLYIAGYDITKTDTFKDKIRIGSYAKYIKELIHRYDLLDKIAFTGLLDEKQICGRFLKSNVFVSSSNIENESNSLSEAKILGVPCVASYVGGVTNRITDKQDGLFYQFDAPYMLAYYVCEIFTNEELALKFSENSRECAKKTHDREENLKTLLDIYKNVTCS